LDEYFRQTIAAIRADAAVYATLVIYLVVGAAYVLANNGMLLGALDIYAHTCLVTYGMILPFIVLLTGIARITHHLDQRRFLAYRFMFGPRRVARFLAGTLLMMLVLLPFEAMFASIKTTISDHGFPYDKALADLDRSLHLGHGISWYLAPLRIEPILRAVEFNYDVVWFVICFGILYWVAISPRAEGMRGRYLATFFLVWVVVGNIAAAMLPTAGPAFYGEVTGDPARFEKLREFVNSTAGWFSSAADEQRYLWALHTSGTSGFGSGISAFPSVHVALIAMNAFFVTEYSRRLALAAWAYVVLIMLSSVYLGWHYGVDGYVALGLAAAIYYPVRWMEGRLQRPAPDRPRRRAFGIPAAG
jgi:hypothetical protein